MDEQRKRLIELVHDAIWMYDEFIEECHKIDGVPLTDDFEYIADYLLANGVIVPPCKVGDMVYRHQKYFNDATLRSEIKIKPCRVVSVNDENVITDDNVWMQFSDFGRTVFLTREEAEAALAERQMKEEE